MGTGAIMPLSTSLSSNSFTFSLQWEGTGIGLCFAFGVALSLRWICAGGPAMVGNGVSLLNAVSGNSSINHYLSLVTFCSVGGMYWDQTTQHDRIHNKASTLSVELVFCLFENLVKPVNYKNRAQKIQACSQANVQQVYNTYMVIKVQISKI